jgi:hypothetical protein
MQEWTEIRRKVLVEHISKRQIIKEYRIGWRTLEKMLAHPEPPGYRKSADRERTKVGRFIGVIEQILKADRCWDQSASPERPLIGSPTAARSSRRKERATGCAMPRQGSGARGPQLEQVRRRGLQQTLQERWEEDTEPANIRPRVLTFSTGARSPFRPAFTIGFTLPEEDP